MRDGKQWLYRKLLDNPIMQDPLALQVFIWLILKVDYTTGKKTLGRFWASSELKMKPITFYKVLKRLEKKYKVVTLAVTGKITEVSLINWHKYQSSNTSSNTSVTHEEHIGNTPKEIRNKNIHSLSENDFLEISNKYKVPIAFVRSKYDDLLLWVEGKPNNPKLKGRNWKLTLMRWVKDDAIKIRKEVGRDANKVSIDIENLAS